MTHASHMSTGTVECKTLLFSPGRPYDTGRQLGRRPMRAKILAIDDEQDIRDLVRYHLEREGHQVGPKALRLRSSL